MRPMANDLVEAGEAPLTAGQERRLRRAVADGNRGNMMRAVAFASASGPARWGFEPGSTSAWSQRRRVAGEVAASHGGGRWW